MTPDPVDAMAAAVHDVRGSIGSIRLALTSVLDEMADDADDFCRSMLTGAEAECRRLNASLTALPALVAAGTDKSDMSTVELGPALEEARRDASRRQVDVRVDATRVGAVAARAASLAQGVAALCVVVGDGDGGVVVNVNELDGRTEVVVARADGGRVRWDRAVVRGLAESLGAELVGGADGVELSFRQA